MYVIRNGLIYSMADDASEPFQGDILVDDQGKIALIAPRIPASQAEGAEEIDAKGCVVIPGFVDAHSHIGGVEMETEDLNEMTKPVTAELDSYYGIDPASKQFETAIGCGITTSCLIPGSGNVIGGWGIVMKSAPGTIAERVIRHPVCLKAATGINPKGIYSKKTQMPMTRMGIAFLLRDYLRQVKEYMEKKAAAEEAKAKAEQAAELKKTEQAAAEAKAALHETEKAAEEAETTLHETEKAAEDTAKETGTAGEAKQPPFVYDLAMEHGIPVLEKKIPLKVHTYMHDMTTVVEIAKEFDILVTIDHAQGASDFYEDLTDEHVHGVIFGPISSGLFPGEGGKIDYECCKGLDDRGVNVTVMTDGPVTPENLLIYQAGEAVRKGMDPIRALRMITINSAKMLYVDDRVGSIEPGKDADIQIYDALPTQYVAANLRLVMSDGKILLNKM